MYVLHIDVIKTFLLNVQITKHLLCLVCGCTDTV